MRSARTPGSPGACLSRTLPGVGTLLVLGAVVVLLAVAPARAGYGGYGPGSYSWTNGTVLCDFNQSLPSVTVSADDLANSGMGAGLGQVEEVSGATGAVVSTAPMDALAWEPENASTDSAYAMAYSAAVPVSTPGLYGTTVGSAEISVTFTLDRVAANSSSADQVDVQMSVEDWPWQSAQDTLALVVPMWPADAATEHLVVSSPSTARIDSVSSSTGQMREYLQVGASAMAGPGAGALVPVPISAQTSESQGVATTTVTLGAAAANATLVSYSATMGIALPSEVLGIPLYDYAAVAGGAGLVALAVGVVTGRLRRTPSDLTYVEEEA